MMKAFKKIFALVLALVMALGMGTKVKADDPTNNQTLDVNVSVSGLEEGDKVKFTQVIKWVDGTGWAWADGMEDAATTAGVTLPELKTITGEPAQGTTPAVAGSISPEHAAVLAKAADKLASPVTTTIDADATTKTATYANAAAGLYYAQVIPGTADYVYNTIFVGADFDSDNGTNTIAADTAKLGTAANAIAKKEHVELNKDSDGNTKNIKYDHNLGDVIPFTITSKVPAYGEGYINPHYVLTDTVETGLELCKADGSAAATTDITVAIEDVTLAAGDYTVALTGATGFTVTLNKAGLDKVAATGNAKTLTVTYKAKITSLENATVTEKTNDATINFSNKPTDETSYSLIEDKTRHYTFSLDANLLGKTGNAYTTDELIKIGKAADGSDLTVKKSYHSGETWTELSPLQGAKFALFKEEPTAGDYASEAAALASDKLYTNTGTPAFNGIVESDADGRLNITGLDAGTYYLREVAAPAGFIKDDRTFTITITADYDTIPAGTYTKNEGGKDILVYYGAYDVLKSYNVAVNDGTNTVNSSYTIEKAGEVQTQKVDKATYIEKTGEDAGEFAGDTVTPISNTQGTELPSTGGIGTTMFYIFGGLLVMGASLVLITRRRMNA